MTAMCKTLQAGAVSPLHILAIDDQPALLDVLRADLEELRHYVTTTCSAREGLALAEQQQPDLILLDFQMPGMNGLQVLQILQQSPATASIPVILLTGDRNVELMREAFKLGAYDFLRKPYDAVELQVRIRNAARLKQAADSVRQLQHLNRLKEDFMSILSHELRTPLTAIMGHTELLLKGLAGSLTPGQVELEQIVMQRSHDLHHVIEDLLQLSRIKAGQFGVTPLPVSLQADVETVLDSTRVLIEERHLKLRVRLPAADTMILADSGALRRILAILLRNAVKFSPAGGNILIGATREDHQVTIHVRDTGIGIAAEQLPIIFESFRQLEGHETRRFEGLGLGLSIAKHLVELQGGRIWAESQVGSGSTFYFTLPTAPPPAWRQSRSQGRKAMPAMFGA